MITFLIWIQSIFLTFETITQSSDILQVKNEFLHHVHQTYVSSFSEP